MKEKDINKALLDTIELVVNKKIADVAYPKIISATISSNEEAVSAFRYKLKYQDGVFYAYSNLPLVFKEGINVDVLLTQGIFNKGTAYIIGTSVKDCFV